MQVCAPESVNEGNLMTISMYTVICLHWEGNSMRINWFSESSEIIEVDRFTQSLGCTRLSVR